MPKRRVSILIATLCVLGVGVGLMIARGFGPRTMPAASFTPGPTTIAAAAPTRAPTATETAAPTDTATAVPTDTATAVPTDTAAPTDTPAPTATPTVEPFVEHVVVEGDILYTIAQRYGVTIEEILAVNSIPNPNSLRVGEVLRIPRR
ncbi:MAG: LysM domain-containing protein [Chloroflexota bacterium]